MAATPQTTSIGHRIIPNSITEAEQEMLVDYLTGTLEWTGDLSRRTHDFYYDYIVRTKSTRENNHEMPEEILAIVTRVLAEHVPEFNLDAPMQIRVNEYLPGQGIGGHADSPVFGPVIVSMSLGSYCVMDLTKGSIKHPIRLHPGSTLVLTGESRDTWKHGIAARKSDPNPKTGSKPKRVKRTTRWSITCRTVE